MKLIQDSKNLKSLERAPAIDPQMARAQQSRSFIHAPVTIFALPKPFVGAAAVAQRNAIDSWKRLSPAVEVLLLGDEDGIAEYATESNVGHVGDVKRNQHGTPLVSSAFEIARQASSSPILVYCNADVILNQDFVRAMEQLSKLDPLDDFVAIGQRTDFKIDRAVDFSNSYQVEELLQQCKNEGKLSSAVCKEYFAFNRDFYQSVPDFAVGRGNWDNWMVAHARAKNVPVIDLTRSVLAIHQAHDYSHFCGSRLNCYVSGDEAKTNQCLAGGRNLIVGSTCTHWLDRTEVKPIGYLRTAINFMRDVPRFIGLMCKVLVQR